MGQEQKTDEIDISDWQTFEDKELGISYRYPGDCGRPNGAGPGTGASLEIICKGLFMMYEPLNYSYVLSDFSRPNYDEYLAFYNQDLEQIANIYYTLNKNYNTEENQLEAVFGGVENKTINNYQAYQFVVDNTFSTPDLFDYSKSSHISALEEKQTITFITNGQRKMLIRILTDDLFSNTVLSTFKFID